MMDRRPYIIFGIAAILILILFLVFKQGGNRFDWTETYTETSKDPYGTFVLYEMLQTYFPGQTFTNIKEGIKSDLLIDSSQHQNYVFVGEAMYMDTADVTYLLDFVEQGNTAFICSKTIPYDLMFYLYYEECDGYYWDDYNQMVDSAGTVNLLHSSLMDPDPYQYKYVFKNQINEYRWAYIDSVFFCADDGSFTKLGYINDVYTNFAKKTYGKGAFYLHTNPITLSNIQLLDETGYTYASKLFTHLDDGPIYWDSFSRTAESVGRRMNELAGGGMNRSLASGGPLQFILAQESLAWAWYLTVLLGLLYLFFRAKRRQRIIPVTEENKNTSLEFISTIGSLYFLQNDHKKLSLQKMKLFLSYVRNHYNLTTGNLDEEFKQRLAIKSEIPRSLIDLIVLYYENIKNSTAVTENTLIDFHTEIDKFYKNCK